MFGDPQPTGRSSRRRSRGQGEIRQYGGIGSGQGKTCEGNCGFDDDPDDGRFQVSVDPSFDVEEIDIFIPNQRVDCCYPLRLAHLYDGIKGGTL